ncbi:STAS domain-containing protein [Lusitaniella coriacea LEGE 07157]|uniref:STAS domain-containing protein n=1 Tax=Lusitaniella coriacea LEGE 07157 TaxID=945747 RepID=A0A8J7B7I1_9CYAN|nr:STAS domain-containing protein [Lusitaniella coriacea]MBE9115399.1 STAS domain-containing protein [Lusitaniella coriacea LEGE 07157]
MNIILRPQRDLDLKEASIIKQALLKCFEAEALQKKSYCIIDLAQVDSIDHFGLFTLIELRKFARRKQFHLRLCNLKKQVQLLLELTELDRQFKTWDKKIEQDPVPGFEIVLC